MHESKRGAAAKLCSGMPDCVTAGMDAAVIYSHLMITARASVSGVS
jgi:hypothetical protein